jgi:putative phage-type endonuclease
VTDPNRDAWLEWRKGGIGASEVPGILGLSSFASPWSIWASKAIPGMPAHETSERQQIGLDLEAAIATMFHRRTGLYVAGEQTWCTHKTETWARCTVDGFVFEGPVDDVNPGIWRRHDLALLFGGHVGLGNFQAKTDGRFGWPDGIPPGIQAQCQYELFVTDMPRTWVAVLHAGFKFEVYELERDQADIDYIVGKVRTFWFDHVLPGNPPEIDGSEATTRAIAEVWPDAKPGSPVDLDDIADRIEQRRKLKEAIKSATAELDVIDNEIKAAMADDEIGCIDGVPVLTYRTITVNRKPQPASTTTYRALKPATKKDLENA